MLHVLDTYMYCCSCCFRHVRVWYIMYISAICLSKLYAERLRHACLITRCAYTCASVCAHAPTLACLLQHIDTYCIYMFTRYLRPLLDTFLILYCNDRLIVNPSSSSYLFNNSLHRLNKYKYELILSLLSS